MGLGSVGVVVVVQTAHYRSGQSLSSRAFFIYTVTESLLGSLLTVTDSKHSRDSTKGSSVNKALNLRAFSFGAEKRSSR